MTKVTSEQNFENAIVAHLVDENRFLRARPEDFDRELCLIPATVIRFLQVTQPERWQSYQHLLNGDAKPRALKRIREVIERKGALYLLRKGFDESGHHFEMCFFEPSSGLNPDLQNLFESNVFQVINDEDPSGGFKYSKYTEQSLDLGIFLNGLPIFTAEIKNEVSGQTVAKAISQYKNDRDPKEALFRFGRVLCHFALDTSHVFIATALAGKKTRFLPFNRGRDGGAGNPPCRTGFATSYLWEKTWTKRSILDLIQRFIQVIDKLDDKGRSTGAKLQIFPRYHQLQTVRKCTDHARKHGPGFSYLNQHSAGSGKTIEIATLANSLATLHGADDKVIFKTVIVLSDRRVIDRQLQRELEQFTQTRGMLENIDKTSRQLKAALEDGKKIIVSTIQKFPLIVGQLAALRSDSFAVIIDEAHSSAAGKTALQVREVLAKGSLEEAERDEGDPDPPTWEDEINEAMESRGHLPHVSYFAFTATPKAETLQLFKTRHSDGSEEVPFTLYTMRQAIEENFILNVLDNYTTYNQYWHLLKKAKEDPTFDKRKANALLRAFVGVHRHAVDKKARIMVDHFQSKVASGIHGKAKGMIVARSRLHAVRYALAVRNYLDELGNPFQALVAFTGTVTDTGKEFTEAGMNRFSEDKTPDMFELKENRLLIVASKYQTGFNQPLLKAMYVDRKLSGVTAVQTLSRLNRTHPGKSEVFVLDFENTFDDIRKAFQPYYDRVALSDEVDPNKLYDIHNDLLDYGIFTPDLIDEFAKVYFGKGRDEVKIKQMHALTDPVVITYKEIEQDEERQNFKSLTRDFVKLYGFLSQIVPFKDKKLEKFYAFAGFLVKKLPSEGAGLPHEVLNMSDLDSYKPELIGEEAIALNRGEAEIDPKNYGAGISTPDEEEVPLSKIIEDLNSQFGTMFTEDDRVVIMRMESRLNSDPVLAQHLKAGAKDAVRLSFEQAAQDILHEMIESNFKFYKKVQDDQDISRELFNRLFERYYNRKDKT